MTQPAGPYPFQVQVGPVFDAPAGASAAPPPDERIDWGAITARETQGVSATPDTDPEQQAWLEAQHSGVETAASQFARGALDALLAPGALVGLEAEAAGELLKNRALRDFGRDLGKAASGRSAAESLEFVFGGGAANMARSAVGQEVEYEEQKSALDASEHAIRQLDEQEQARPTLSMVSRIAGMAAAAIGMGAGAGGSSGVATTLGANVAEGAAGGAQAAYEKSAPLRDVLASAAIGGVLSGGITGAAQGVQAGIKRTPDLARVFGEKVQQFADARAVKSVVGRDPKAWRALLPDGDTTRVARVAERIRAEDIIGKSDEGMLEALEKGAERAGADLDKVAAHLDQSGIAPQYESLFAAWDQQIARLRSSGSGTQQSVADALEREIAPFRRKLVGELDETEALATKQGLLESIDPRFRDQGLREESFAKVRQEFDSGAEIRPVDLRITPDENGVPRLRLEDGRHRVLVAKERGLDSLPAKIEVMDANGDIVKEIQAKIPLVGREAKPVTRNPTFAELRQLKTAIGKATKWHQTSQSMATEEMQRLYGATARELSAAADQAGPEVAGVWKRANEAYSDFAEMSDALGREMQRNIRNRFVSMSDYQTGVAGALASAVMSGNPITAIAMGAASAIGHKALREGGGAILSSLANRFARMSSRVTARGVGEETREVLSLLSKSRMFIDETGERAGANPTLRQAAQETAQQVAAQEIAKKAGVFIPSEWAAKPLSAVQKVVYRGQILDAVAGDLSRVAKAAEEIRMPMPVKLDPKRIAKFAKSARGPEAIGSVQQALGAVAEQAPPTPLGDAAGVELRNVMAALDRTDVPETMARAHELVAWLDQAAARPPDEVSQNYALRASQAIRDKLGSDAFGEAGTLYRQMQAPPTEAWKAIQDEAAIRESLRKYDEPGHLPAIVKQHNDDLANAYGARFRLTGEPVPRELGAGMKRMQKLFGDAERAVTLDGRGVSRVFDAANAAGVYAGGRAVPHETVGEQTVHDAIEPELVKILPALKGAAPRALARVATREPQTPEEQRKQYDKRAEMLARTISSPESIAETNVHPTVAASMAERMNNLMRDMPKPSQSIRGKAFETMSSEDIRLANSMWEATTEPLSVFSDFAGGAVDYDKVQYAWKQWPGLQQAAQAGVMDLLTSELDDKERAALPEAMLTQLDYLLGFQGTLQPTLDYGFGQRMSALFQPDPNKPAPGGTLQPTPGAQPTFTQRLAGAPVQ